MNKIEIFKMACSSTALLFLIGGFIINHKTSFNADLFIAVGTMIGFIPITHELYSLRKKRND